MNINEQAENLRELAGSVDENKVGYWTRMEYEAAFEEAADTIEDLSEKLAKMERPVEHKYRNDPVRPVEDCSGGWIYCGDGKNLPEERDSMFAKFKDTEKWDLAMFERISDDVNVTVEFENGTRKVKTLHTVDGKWNGGQRGVKFKVVAWKPLPEEYHG